MMRESSGKLAALRRQRDELIEDAQAHPGSESTEIVRMLLLAGLSHMHPDPYSEAPGLALGAESRRVHRSRPRRPERFETADGAGAAEPAPARESAREVEQKYRDAQAKLAKVAQVMSAAQQPGAPQSLDAAAVYEKIAEIIGLRTPPGGEARSPAGAPPAGSS